jgi:hypothetical protein
MLIKDLEKLRKRTLRERIYEEIVHPILSGELPSRRMGGRETGHPQAAVESNPIS